MNKAILLYRFLSAEGAIKTIEGRAFRVSRLLELNDPFEWSAGVEGLEKLPPEKAELVNLDQESFLKQLNERFGIICSSATFRDPVLWSHYTDSHRGLAIEVSHDLDESLHKVEYTDDRPTIHLAWAQNPAAYAAELREIFLAFFKRKSLGWSYEKEYRGVAELASCAVAGGDVFQEDSRGPCHAYNHRASLGGESVLCPPCA